MVSFWEMFRDDPNIDPALRALLPKPPRVIDDEPRERDRDDGPDFPPEVLRDGH